MKTILGTATFGSSYGIANSGKRLEEHYAKDVLTEAAKLGITHLDTSPAYANAEEIIGKYHQSNTNRFNIYSKISSSDTLDLDSTIQRIKNSLTVTGVEKFEGIYFHDPRMLKKFHPPQVKELIEKILELGLAHQVGASVYTEEEIHWLTTEYPIITLFQVPENILDQRLINSDLLKSLANKKIEFHVRSVFLQGILLLEPEKIPESVREMKNYIVELQKLSKEFSTTVMGLCLSYLRLIEYASSYVVGVANPTQLQEIMKVKLVELSQDALPTVIPARLVDPRNWNHS